MLTCQYMKRTCTLMEHLLLGMKDCIMGESFRCRSDPWKLCAKNLTRLGRCPGGSCSVRFTYPLRWLHSTQRFWREKRGRKKRVEPSSLVRQWDRLTPETCQLSCKTEQRGEFFAYDWQFYREKPCSFTDLRSGPLRWTNTFTIRCSIHHQRIIRSHCIDTIRVGCAKHCSFVRWTMHLDDRNAKSRSCGQVLSRGEKPLVILERVQLFAKKTNILRDESEETRVIWRMSRRIACHLTFTIHKEFWEKWYL